MTGISKQGCLTLARYNNREMVRARKRGDWSMVLHSRLVRDSYMASARLNC